MDSSADSGYIHQLILPRSEAACGWVMICLG